MVALSGGVFQNTLLLGLARRELEARGFTSSPTGSVPPNDGGLALGQAAVAGYPRRAPGRDGGIVAVVDTAADRRAARRHRPRTWPPPRSRWPAASPPAPPCGAWPRVAQPRPPRGRRVRPPGHRGQARAAGGARRRPRGCRSPVRQLARPGDVLLVVSTADDPVVARPRSPGPTPGASPASGSAPGPSPGGRRGDARADHVVWLETDDAAVAARSGDLVLLYHLLWELTHVVFEHPGCSPTTRPRPARHVRRRRLHHLLGRGPGGRGPRRCSTRDASRSSPAATPNRSTAGWSGTCGPVTSCWCTPAWPSRRSRSADG